MRLARVFGIIVVLWGISGSALAADVLHMRDGRRVEGIVVGQDRTQVRIRVNGRVETHQKSSIRRVEYGAVPDRAAIERKRAEEARQKRERERKEEERRAAEERSRKASAAEQARQEKERARRLGREWYQTAGRTNTDALWRSAVLPGWGHLYKEQDYWAYGYVGALAGALIATRVNRAHATTDRASYERNTIVSTLWGAGLRSPELVALTYGLDSGVRTRYRNSLRRYHLSVSLLGFAYIGQLLHAYFIAPAARGGSSKAARGLSQPEWSLEVQSASPSSPLFARGNEERSAWRFRAAFAIPF